MRTIKVIFLVLFLILSTKTVFSVEESIFDPKFDKSSITIRRVAIIANRLPLTLEDPEKWRKFNWEILNKLFTKRGFEVVDYETTLQAVMECGLPLEDTGVPEEKFACAASSLNVDILIMPYYGTNYWTKRGCIGNDHKFAGIVEFQIYSKQTNTFIFRTDKISVSSFNDMANIPYINLIGTCLTMTNSPGKMWSKAFNNSTKKALEPFFAVYPGTEESK